jgi:hypothetical protein
MTYDDFVAMISKGGNPGKWGYFEKNPVTLDQFKANWQNYLGVTTNKLGTTSYKPKIGAPK